MATKLSMCLTWMKTILLESQLQKTVGTEPVMFHHIIQFYLAVGLFTQSQTSALVSIINLKYWKKELEILEKYPNRTLEFRAGSIPALH